MTPEERRAALAQAGANDAGLTGAQIAIVRAEAKRQAAVIIEDFKIRQWCVDKALTHVGSYNDIESLTNFFYDFVTNKEKPDAQRA